MTESHAKEIAKSLIAHYACGNISIQLIDTPKRNTLAIAVWDDGEHCVVKALNAWCTKYQENELVVWILYELGNRADR